MRAIFSLPLCALLLAALAPATASAADPIACQQLNAGLTAEQRPKLDRWLRQTYPGGDFTIDYTCNIDDKRALGPYSTVASSSSQASVCGCSGWPPPLAR